MVDVQITAELKMKLKRRVGVMVTLGNTVIFAKRALIRMRKNPEQLFDAVFSPVLFTLLFAFLLGGAVAGSVSSYLPILIPGVLVMTTLTSCGTAATQIKEDMDKSSTKRFKAMPISRFAPVAGVLVADLLRFAIAGSIVFITGFFLGFAPDAGIWSVFASLFLVMFVGWCFSWLFAWIGMLMKSATGASMFTWLIMFPLTFLSNAFVPAETLPMALKFFVDYINPLTKVISAVREMLYVGTIGSDFWFAILGSLVVLVIFVPLTLYAYNRKT